MKLKYKKIYRWTRDIFFILFGSVLMALGIGVFLVDAHVVPGGASGLAMAIHYISDGKIPVGILIWLINIPLFLWGIKELGKQFGIRTFLGFSFTSFFVDFFRGDLPLIKTKALQNTLTIQILLKEDFFFLILCGAFLLGVGLGVVFKFKGTTGGSDILAAIFSKKFGAKPGQVIMLVDFFVISFAGFVLAVKNFTLEKPVMALTLYAFFLLFVSSYIIDKIIDGFSYARSVIIISEKSDEIADAILNGLSRGATALKGRGLYLNKEKEIILSVVTRKEVGLLKEMAKDIDPKSFIIINEVYEVLGEGFKPKT